MGESAEGKQLILVVVVLSAWIYCLHLTSGGSSAPGQGITTENFPSEDGFEEETIEKHVASFEEQRRQQRTIEFDRLKMPVSGGRFCEGYWNSPDSPDPLKDDFGVPLPVPTRGKWTNTEKKKFLTALSALEESDFIQTIAYRGLSPCRLCNELNGNEEYVLQPQHQVKEEGGEEGEEEKEVCWPSGYGHYVAEHGVVPSKQFHEMVMKLVF